MNSISTLCQLSQKKFLETQISQQKYLISDSDRNRTLNEALRLLQAKKIGILSLKVRQAKIHICQQCNKKFQSLTALSTHSKKQHPQAPLVNGEQRRRGRPRRDAPRPNDQFTQWQQQYIMKQEEELQPKRISSLSSLQPEQLIAFNNMPRCKTYSDKTGLVSLEMLDEKESIQRLLDMLQPTAEEHQIIKFVEEFSSMEDQDFLICEDLPVIQFYSAFLVNLGCFCTDKLLRLMIIFIKALISFTDSFAQQELLRLDDSEFKGIIPNQNRIFHEIMPIKLFPLITNSFLRYLPNYFIDFDIKLATLILKDMCDWLYREIQGFKVQIRI